MELFAAAGIDLPIGTAARPARRFVRSLRVPLFAYKVVEAALQRDLVAFDPSEAQRAAARDYAKRLKNPKFMKQKETSVRPVFIQQVLTTLLGYTDIGSAGGHTLAFEHPIRNGAVDVALGRFSGEDDGRKDEIVAPFELKGPDTVDLDQVMPGRGRSPVQQAWDYAIDAPGSRWVLVSNCVEIRLYGFGRGRDAYEVFDLTKLDDEAEHRRLWLMLHADRFLSGQTDALLRETDSAYKDITNDLYKQYKSLRDKVFGFLVDASDGPRLTSFRAIEVAQKVLDRILFIAFAQRTGLLPERLLERAASSINDFSDALIWTNFQSLFRAVDVGNLKLQVPAYNGGLFALDPDADALVLPDPLAGEVAELGKWDFRRDVPVTVLGHIFEQSITDIEAQKNESLGLAPPKTTKRKREGVVYTPDIITRFLVERTIGLTLDERRASLWVELGMDAVSGKADPKQEAFWRAMLESLRSLTIVDPACGSGAFLVAAFDELARRYREAASALASLGSEIDFDIFDEIVTKNLYGVDLNAESVEITRLSLWLKTARRDHKLQNLEATIRVGNSLVDDAAFSDRPFDWHAAFPGVFAQGGFNVVIGNPPYVRMELIKPVKPYLAKNYTVYDGSLDLYGYFFEQGNKLLKPEGRLGYVSSATFFRTGSGEKLRTFLSDGLAIEAVIDFGDLQIFEGVTTYPTILTARKSHAQKGGDAGALSYLNVKQALPDDLGRAFSEGSLPMPRSRLGSGSWRFETDALAALRAKIATGRPTLGEAYGAPRYGIKTGLNEAFVIDRPTRDRLVAADPKSAELLKPFLRGEDVKRWCVESKDFWLIFARQDTDIEHYPAVKRYLMQFRRQLEPKPKDWPVEHEQAEITRWKGRKQGSYKWYETQDTVAYWELFSEPKIIFERFQHKPNFCLDKSGGFPNNALWVIPTQSKFLLSVLNSKFSDFYCRSQTTILSGDFYQINAHQLLNFPLPNEGEKLAFLLAKLGQTCTDAARERYQIQSEVRHRILDLAPGAKLGKRLSDWHLLDFAAFREEAKRTLKCDIPVKERRDWELYLTENAAKVNALTKTIEAAETEIDQTVYGLFDLTPEEITLLETSIAPTKAS